MMRFLAFSAICMLLLGASTAVAQAPAARVQQQTGQAPAGQNRAAAQQNPSAAQQHSAATQPSQAPQTPFPPLSAEAQQQLDRLLQAWEVQSKGTDTLQCDFTRWHYDLVAAPAGVHSTWAKGHIRYAAPDKGLFKVETLKFFKGMVEGKPAYDAVPGEHGEHWVCNGTEVIDFDHGKQECTIRELPPELQGTQIFESPLPFVFNLDAKKIRERYWVRQLAAPKAGVLLIEAWPKRQEDRAQYRLVQVVIAEQTFLPEALLVYAPNFDPQTAPSWDHYEFENVERNAIKAGLQGFLNLFIKQKPPASWKVIRERYQPIAQPAQEQIAQPPVMPRR